MPQPDATVFVVDDDASIRQALAGLILMTVLLPPIPSRTNLSAIDR
jgi:hypothetical protein